PEFTPTRDLLKRIYRRWRQDSLEGRIPPDKYRQWLGFQVRKYGLTGNQYRALQPSDLPDESPLPPQTTITDDFSGSLSAWTMVDPSGEGWSISSGRLVRGNTDATNFPASMRHNSALSGDDHYAQILQLTQPAGATSFYGPAARFASDAETYYHARFREANSGQSLI